MRPLFIFLHIHFLVLFFL